MSDAPDDMIVDSRDTPSQSVDRTGKRELEEEEGCEKGEKSVLLHSNQRPPADYSPAPISRRTTPRTSHQKTIPISHRTTPLESRTLRRGSGSTPSIEGIQPSNGWPRSFVRISSELNTDLPILSLRTPPQSVATKGSYISRNQESMSLHDDSFRESFTFITPFYFQKSVTSIPDPPPRRWKFPVAHEGTNADPSSKPTDSESLYLFGKRVEIRDLEMEDSSQGVADHLSPVLIKL